MHFCVLLGETDMDSIWCAAEGGAASQALATASARALSEGGEPALAVARAFAYAIAVFSCPGVKPVIYCASPAFHLIYPRAALQIFA